MFRLDCRLRIFSYLKKSTSILPLEKHHKTCITKSSSGRADEDDPVTRPFYHGHCGRRINKGALLKSESKISDRISRRILSYLPLGLNDYPQCRISTSWQQPHAKIGL